MEMKRFEELTQYTQQYFPEEFEACSTQVEEARDSGDETGAEQIISDFYGFVQEAAIADERAFDVRSLAEDHGALVVTAVRTYGNLGPFRPINHDDFKGVRLFDILLRPGQIACCSTVKAGDSAANLYSSWGVIIGEGRIRQAYPYDATTSVNNGEVVSQFQPRIASLRPTEQIHQALNSRHGLWNEIDTSVDKVAGVFYSVDEGEQPNKDFPSKVLRDLIKPLDLRQYLLRNGSFHPIDDNSDVAKGNFDVPTSPVEIVRHNYTPNETEQDEMIAFLTSTLTLAPRNAITSGVARGQFVYDFGGITRAGSMERFTREQETFLASDNPSLRLYGAMALHAFAEAATADSDHAAIKKIRTIASAAISTELYTEYKQRILPTGNLAVTEADFRHYLDTGQLPAHLQDH
jgi:hypothetical protein